MCSWLLVSFLFYFWNASANHCDENVYLWIRVVNGYDSYQSDAELTAIVTVARGSDSHQNFCTPQSHWKKVLQSFNNQLFANV